MRSGLDISRVILVHFLHEDARTALAEGREDQWMLVLDGSEDARRLRSPLLVRPAGVGSRRRLCPGPREVARVLRPASVRHSRVRPTGPSHGSRPGREPPPSHRAWTDTTQAL